MQGPKGKGLNYQGQAEVASRYQSSYAEKENNKALAEGSTI